MATIDEVKTQLDSLTKVVEKKLLTPASGTPTETVEKSLNPNNPGIVVPAAAHDPKEEGRWGFKSMSHFLHEVRQGSPQNPSEFIKKAYNSETVKKAATGMGELVGADGGFLVPPTFSSTIFERVYNENNLLARTDQYTAGGNVMVFPRNAESSRATGSRWGGVRAYWVQEGSTITNSAPTFGQLRLQLNKLACLARVTQELITDSSTAMETYLSRVFALEIGFTANNAIFRGTGAGQPLGLLNAPCAVTVSAESGQTAATIVSANIAKMWARRFALGPTGSYVWLINQDVLPQLYLLTLGIGTAGVTTFMPPGGLSGAPYSTLMGAPIMEVEFASTLGTVGDIALVDLSQIVSITQGMQSMSSMHVYFVTDEQAFKTTYRMDAAPWQASALTPFQGTNTQSPIVLLATR